jgi:tetratricopeptide (TPR) repeat protein
MMKNKYFLISCVFLALYPDASYSMALIAGTTRASPSLNLPTAEADRALRYAASLENAGMPRTAHALYHESATLYQCLLDSSEFSHVSELEQIHDSDSSKKAQSSKESTLKSYLTYACMRLGYLSHDALSDPRAALRLYKEATTISSQPPAEAFDGLGICIESSGGSLKEAVASYKKSLAIQDNGMVWFHLAVALERLGEAEEAEEIMESLRRAEAKYACLVDSWGYVRFHTRRTPNEELNLYLGTRDMLKIGIEAAMDLVMNQNGLLCEFGVATGRSMRIIQEFLPLDTKLHGFDTFTGLPLPWNDLPVGSFSTNGNIPNVDGEVYFHRGLFRDSIPRFLESSTDEFQPLAFVNIDVLMYSSTLDILEGMHSRVVAGTVFVFADYTSHPTWRQDEFRAWREACKRFGWRYEYLGFSLATKQAVVRVTSA